MAGSASEEIYSRAFFDLQLQFAHKVTELSGLSLEQALLDYTNLYIRFALGRRFDPADVTWQAYLSGLRGASDAGEWTHRFYLTRLGKPAGPSVVASFGCFSYAALGDDRIKLHFRDAERDGRSPLGSARVAERRADLTELFGHVKRTSGSDVRVLGASWLYNLDAYRRLFPPAYVSTARIVHRGFQRMPLWGQFLNRYGRTKDSMTRPFFKRLEQQSSLDRLNECFAFQLLTVEAPVPEFFRFYGL